MSVACGRIHQGHERFSDDPQGRQMIFKRLVAHSQYSLPVDHEALIVIVVEFSKSLPVEVNNSTIELHFPVDSRYSLPVKALNLIVKSKSIKSFFMEINFFSVHSAEFFLSFEAKMLPLGVNCRLI